MHTSKKSNACREPGNQLLESKWHNLSFAFTTFVFIIPPYEQVEERLMKAFTDDHTYIHVFNVHLCLLLQLHDNLSVEPLELWTKTDNALLECVATSIILLLRCPERNASWVTWFSGDVTIRVEWLGGMYDNGFLRRCDFHLPGRAYQPVTVKDLQLSPLREQSPRLQESLGNLCLFLKLFRLGVFLIQ